MSKYIVIPEDAMSLLINTHKTYDEAVSEATDKAGDVCSQPHYVLKVEASVSRRKAPVTVRKIK